MVTDCLHNYKKDNQFRVTLFFCARDNLMHKSIIRFLITWADCSKDNHNSFSISTTINSTNEYFDIHENFLKLGLYTKLE